MYFTLTILLVGVVSAALSVVFIRESTEPPVMLAAYRVLLAAVFLLPVYLREKHRFGEQPLIDVGRRSLLPGLVLAAHFILWVVGARMTTAANANLIVNLMPVVMPFFMLLMFSATIIAIIGMLVLTFNDFTLNRAHFQGDLLCLAAMILFAYYLALARKHRKLPSVWLYIVPVYAVAGVSTFLIALLFSSPLHHYTPYNIAMILSLALISTVVGHSALNYAMQRLRGQTVSVVNMAQFIIGGVCGYYLYHEIPSVQFYIASSWLLVSMGLVIFNQSKENADNPS